MTEDLRGPKMIKTILVRLSLFVVIFLIYGLPCESDPLQVGIFYVYVGGGGEACNSCRPDVCENVWSLILTIERLLWQRRIQNVRSWQLL